MNELEFTFDITPLMALVDGLQPGQKVSAAKLLALSESESETALEEALLRMEELGICLELEGLDTSGVGAEMSQRLQLEQTLARDGFPLERLEENDTLRLYLEELAAIPVCGDVALLAGQLDTAPADRQEHLRQQLMELSLSRVVELAGNHTGKGVLLMDLIQEGSVGLWQTTQEYTGSGADFESVRDQRIRFYMARQILLQAKSCGVGQMLRRAMEDYRQVDERLLAELGRNPEPEELAQAMHLSLQQTILLSQLVENTRQMGKTIQPEPEELPQEEDQAVEDTAYFQMRQRISELLSQLTQEDAKLISLRYGLEGDLPMKPQQVAARLGITPEQVVQREAAALSKLRESKD